MKKYCKYLLGGSVWLLPALVLAQDLGSLFINFTNIINKFIIPLLFAVGGVVFLWGVVEFVTSAGDEEKRKTGRQHMIWGVIGLAIMVGFWGLVNAVVNYFSLGKELQELPRVLPPQ